jgi:SAM-dependent methyltransferase
VSRRSTTIEPGWFDGLYRADPDPWRFKTSEYEREKYGATLAALSRPRYAHGLEIGCAIGILTRQLATRCDHLLAVDASSVALETARAECATCPNVDFSCRMVPSGFPEGRFVVILLSEVLYYLVAGDLAAVAQRCFDALEPGGEIVLCHWLGETDYPLSGQQASDLFVADALKRGLAHARLADATYRLERLHAPRVAGRAAAPGSPRRG